MSKKIMRKLTISEISSVDRPASKAARATIIKNDTQGARADAIEQLRQKRIADYMAHNGVSRSDAEAAIGNVGAYKSATAADTCVASITALADYEGVTMAKFLDTDVGRSLYTSYADAKNEPRGGLIAKRKISSAFDALVDLYVKQHGINRWKAANEVLKSKLGAEIYKAMREAT